MNAGELEERLRNVAKLEEDLEEELRSVAKLKEKLEDQISDLVAKKEVAQENMCNSSLEEFLSQCKRVETGYVAGWVRKPQPKCSLCDENRLLKATAENGKTYYVDCDCSHKVNNYYPEKVKFVSFAISKKVGELPVFRFIYEDVNTGKFSEGYKIVDAFNRADFPLWRNDIIFTTKKEAQKYCDYLTGKTKDKEN